MLENITSLIDTRRVESCSSPNSVKVIREVMNLMKNNPTCVLAGDLSDYPLPRMSLRINVATDNLFMGIVVEGLLGQEDIEIGIFDATLKPGTPTGESFSYRVNVFGGKAAESYMGSTGYAFAKELFQKIQEDGNSLIVSDNWAETNLQSEDVLSLLGSITKVTLPNYDPFELTESKTQRYTPLS